MAGISNWRATTDSIEQQVAREEAADLARNIAAAEARLKQNKTQLADLNEQLAPGLQARPRLVPMITGTLPPHTHTTAGSGTKPRSRPSSGGGPAGFLGEHHKTPAQPPRRAATEHGVGRDHQIPHAVRRSHQKYMERRTTEGLSHREIKRVLKRYLPRNIFRQLQQRFPSNPP